jgi:hypothetical protein
VASPLSRLAFPIALGLGRKLRADRAERLAMEMGAMLTKNGFPNLLPNLPPRTLLPHEPNEGDCVQSITSVQRWRRLNLLSPAIAVLRDMRT